jgi:hypothetical protein
MARAALIGHAKSLRSAHPRRPTPPASEALAGASTIGGIESEQLTLNLRGRPCI